MIIDDDDDRWGLMVMIDALCSCVFKVTCNARHPEPHAFFYSRTYANWMVSQMHTSLPPQGVGVNFHTVGINQSACTT